MATSSQTALTRLGFKDPDKQNPRHGLACEYLKEKMSPFVGECIANQYKQLAKEATEELAEYHKWRRFFSATKDSRAYSPYDLPDSIAERVQKEVDDFQSKSIDYIKIHRANQIAELSTIVKGPSSGTKGFLDVSFRDISYVSAIPKEVNFAHEGSHYTFERNEGRLSHVRIKVCIWGEVKIAPVTPEILLQQIEYYAQNLPESDMIWLLADFDISDFKRMVEHQYPQLKCFRVGQSFDEWCEKRYKPEVAEL
jgi:hypothetical protein